MESEAALIGTCTYLSLLGRVTSEFSIYSGNLLAYKIHRAPACIWRVLSVMSPMNCFDLPHKRTPSSFPLTTITDDHTIRTAYSYHLDFVPIASYSFWGFNTITWHFQLWNPYWICILTRISALNCQAMAWTESCNQKFWLEISIGCLFWALLMNHISHTIVFRHTGLGVQQT